MGEKKVKVVDVAAATGLHRNTLSLLYKETAVRIELDAIEKLCRYFDISVGELFELNDDAPAKPNDSREEPMPKL